MHYKNSTMYKIKKKDILKSTSFYLYNIQCHFLNLSTDINFILLKEACKILNVMDLCETSYNLHNSIYMHNFLHNCLLIFITLM